ncbi:serine--tRNA ligase [Paenibacillus oenotherae]|uniref:Serine--tRNA ligase n=1 Tax=Paenibacillus oenotherae TaxID=1435645 RepID=A0ABS7DC86_9BACL|nr:serine--tRNA ligase [Paenibacillus oenotherae]MBW7477542.1 serine--tRNA ligase [Paenibacillus oenotherae]
MLDIAMIRQRRKEIGEAAVRKGLTFDVEELLAVDERRRRALAETEELRAQRNRGSAAVEQLLRDGRRGEADTEKRINGELAAKLKGKEAELRELEAEYKRLLLLVPNLISPDTPEGTSDHDNVEVMKYLEPPVFDFEPRSHIELGETLDLIDLVRGVKIGGTRQYVLRNHGVLLHRAVQQLAADIAQEQGFTLLDVPIMVREETLVATGFFPDNREGTYAIDGEDKWLAGTSEVPLVSYYSGETLDLSEPELLAAASACYRGEVGSAGRDVHGLYRVHAFAKVEQVVICRADLELAEELLQRILMNARTFVEKLELPYRIVAVCAGDMSQKNYKQYDIETWMPSRNSYGETHSASSILDFQARRAGIRYRDDDGRLQYAFTLNCTIAASPRILIPLLENHQLEDGSVYIPEALRPYMNGIKELHCR